MKQASCKGEHEGHLCVLAGNGKFKEIQEMSRAPRFICFNCGRVAACDHNLCNPMAIDS